MKKLNYYLGVLFEKYNLIQAGVILALTSGVGAILIVAIILIILSR